MSGGARPGGRWLPRLALAAAATLVMAALLELAAIAIWRTDAGGEWLRRARSSYYQAWSRRIVQFDPESAVYDPELSYRLRPGAHRFANREFDTVITVNSDGLRDDEDSLDRPEVIVLGDSFALGWGVEDEETLASSLERRTGLKTLNAAMSSYGTARELLLLRRLDSSALRYLVVQYCSNDDQENESFLTNGRLQAMSRRDYERVVSEHRRRTRYRPLRLAVELPRFLWIHRAELGRGRRSLEPLPGDPGLKSGAESFLRVLDRLLPESGPPFPVIALRLGYAEDLAAPFERVTGRLLAEERFSRLRSRVSIVRAADVLRRDDFFPLDQHLRASGHQELARAVAGEIARLEESRGATGPAPATGEPADRGPPRWLAPTGPRARSPATGAAQRESVALHAARGRR